MKNKYLAVYKGKSIKKTILNYVAINYPDSEEKYLNEIKQQIKNIPSIDKVNIIKIEEAVNKEMLTDEYKNLENVQWLITHKDTGGKYTTMLIFWPKRPYGKWVTVV